MKRELLDNGNIWQKSDGRWIGMVRYKDEFGVAQRKSFSSKKKKTLQAKMTEYVKNFNEQVANSDESRKPLKESMKNRLRVYKYPEVERTTYDRYECTAEHQIYPYIGNKPVYQQAAAYFLMLNTGLRAGELCGVINSDIDLDNRVIHLQRGVKEVHVRDGLEYVPKLEVKVGKLKSKTSKRDVPLNDTAIEMIQRLRKEVYLGEDAPLIPDENGNFTNPRNMRNRFYRILPRLPCSKGKRQLSVTYHQSKY